MPSLSQISSYKNNFHDFKLPDGTKVISVFASGFSIKDITDEEIAFIKSKSFMFSLNYAPWRYVGHVNMWSDVGPTEDMMKIYSTRPKDCLLMSRTKCAFYPSRTDHMNFLPKVDLFFDVQEYALKGTYTIVWLLQMIRNYISKDLPILIFGLDMYKSGKWYDDFTQTDSRNRGKSFNDTNRFQTCNKELKTTVSPNNIYNCNMKSAFDGFQKVDYRDFLKP